jgi:hypothetical protein
MPHREDDLTPEQETIVRAMVRERIKQAAELSREILWASRGGIQHLTPVQATEYALTVAALDRLISVMVH